MSTVRHTPAFSTRQAAALVGKIYGLRAEAAALPSERDQNFIIRTDSGERFVFKIANGRENLHILEAENRAMIHAERNGAPCPRVIPAVSGDFIATIHAGDGGKHFVRLISFLPGVPMGSVKRHTPELFTSLGRCVGRMDRAFADFDHPALHRDFHWDLARGLAVVDAHRPLVADEKTAALIDTWIETFRLRVLPLLPDLRKSVIHNDANDYNVIVGNGDDGDLHGRNQQVVGIVDFGDMVHSYTVCNPAIAIAYAILDKPDPLAVAGEILRGYHDTFPLREIEVAALFGFVGLRLCQSACLAAYQQRQQPDNPYLAISQAPIRRTLPKLAAIHYDFACAALRHACGWAPQPAGAAVVRSLDAGEEPPHPIFGDDRPPEQWIVSDLGVSGSLSAGNPEIPDPAALKRRIGREMALAGAAVAVGRHDEPRLPCACLDDGDRLAFTLPGGLVHLGLDLFAEPETPVYAPFAGHVAGICTAASPGESGAALLLEHRTRAGGRFFTRYRGLAGLSGPVRQTGQAVEKGERIGCLAGDKALDETVSVLRFQVMTHLLDRGIDFPVFCAARHRFIWKSFSPDPNRILKIPAHRFPDPPSDNAALLDGRRRHFAGNLKIGYRNPLKIERGWMQHLYDHTGRRYLDAYNNVPHVGHCHPRVVDAVARQMGILNTNTRYLGDLLNRYAQRLCGTMPDPLNVCFFVNSASEGNELALRLARSHTGARDLIVVEGAYHGNTTTLIDVSPYKHDGPGGTGAPPWVHRVPLADTFRGPYRGNDPEAAAKYAGHAGRVIAQIRDNGHGLCGFITEACPSVGGQILFPRGYLAAVFERVRAAGGVCIVDEVQTAYGRIGTHFYGFQAQGVMPDIVVLGKPIGNGYPIGAVVTTPDIAASFDTGMEFFSTFGGSTVSCAAGLAVLDVVEAEHLQGQALKTGTRLMAGLDRLKAAYPLVGDVRGSGLFLGVELVKDRDTLEPAPEAAAFVADRMREAGVLLGTDGIHHNVIKIRPPMPFDAADADRLVDVMERVLAEDFAP